MKAMLRFLVERDLVVNLVSIMLIFLGLFAAWQINREAFPNVNLDQITISVVYPGATPEEVERLVITPIEQEVKSLSGVDKMTSVAFPGSGRVILELDPDAGNRDRMTSDVQLAVDRADLPDDLPAEPFVLEIDGAVFPIINLAISAPVSELELKRLVDKISDDVLAIPGVARVTAQGNRKAEMRVTVKPEKMREHRVSISEISTLLSSWNINAPGGDIDTPEGQKSLRIVGEFRNVSDIENLILRANERGGGLPLKEVATITENLADASVYYDVGGKPAMNMIIMKKADADIINTVDKTYEYVNTINERYGADVQADTFQDMSRFARARLGILTNNGMVGLVLVFIALVMFLRPSVALTTTWGLPIVFLTGLYVLYINGITLNLISMMGFIMVLGMLVDDAIIVGENITYHMERGLQPREAAVIGAYELMGPVTATVLTTIVAFLPMMFMPGMIGKFIVAIPTVVILLLFFSWLESFLMLPSHVAFVANPKQHPGERRWIKWMEDLYARVLEVALRFRWGTLLLAIMIFAGSLVLAKNSSFQLFPPVGVDIYLVRVTAPAGSSLEALRKELKAVDSSIRQNVNEEYLETSIISSGQIQMDGGDPLMQRGARYGQIRVIYQPAVTRQEHDALDDMRKLQRILPQKFPHLKIAFTEMRPGPPVGRALEVEIASNDTVATERVASRLMEWLRTVEGVTSVESGLQPGDKEVHVRLDRELAAYAGVNLMTAASHIRAASGGLVVSTTRRATEEIDVTIRFPERKNELDNVMSLDLPNQRGGLVPLSRIARFVESDGFSTIRHKAGIRVVSIIGNIDSEVITSQAVNKLVREKQNDWTAEDSKLVSINYGGEAEKNQESFVSLGFSFIFAMIGIFFILAIQFNNLTYPIAVMMAIPFGAIGIIVSFYLHDMLWKPMPLSFFAMMGMVALSGVVVNSSLILLVFIQRALKDGMGHIEAIILAGRRRLRAVILTAATTVLGLLPTAYGWGGSDPFVAPMALALSWGLIFSTVITLIVIPAIFAASVDMKHFIYKILRKPLPEPTK